VPKTDKTDLEAAFDFQFRVLANGLPLPEMQFKFHPERKWLIDRAWPVHKVAVELEGGSNPHIVKCHNCGQVLRAKKGDGSPGKALRIPGFHQTNQFQANIEKYNALSAAGWILLRFTNANVYDRPAEMVDDIRAALESRSGRVALAESDTLSDRQKEVLYLVAAGLKTSEIAASLRLKESVVRKYTQAICEKLVVNNRASAVARGITWGMIDPDKIPWTEDASQLFDIH